MSCALAAAVVSDGSPIVAGAKGNSLGALNFSAVKLDAANGGILWEWTVSVPYGAGIEASMLATRERCSCGMYQRQC